MAGAFMLGYDGLGREISRQDPRRSQPSLTSYLPGADQISAVTDAAGNTTSYRYYPQGQRGAGKIRSVTLADGSVSWSSYTQRGELMATWGSQTNPTWRVYDGLGQMISLHTWQVDPNFNASAMPASPPAGSSVTSWIYDAATGLLAAKRDAANLGASYTYDVAGRLSSRTWARSSVASPQVTSYQYNEFSQLISSDYSDATPDASHVYDRLGRSISHGSSVAKSDFSYDAATLLLDTETVSYNLDAVAGYEFSRVLDRSQDALLRESGWQLKDGTNTENSVSYGYSATSGRLESVNSGGGSHPPSQFNYSYLANSNLIESVASPAHTVFNTYEAQRDVLDAKENKAGTSVVSRYDYSVNGIGQRTSLSQTGTAFAGSRDVAWGYDSLGQLTRADSSIPDLDRAYQFDMIGNRLKTADSLTLPSTNNYTPNALNQYTAIGALSPVHDADGNATAHPLPANLSANSSLVWDCENRLIAAQVLGAGVVNFSYDSQGRRIVETVGTTSKINVYDGWNPVAEYAASAGVSPALSQSFTWGIDLSGSLQGAGGVGGLLAVSDSSGSYFPTYAGNGNVSADSSGQRNRRG